MKTYGDIPEIHQEILEELVLLEHWFNEHEKDLPVLDIAKGFVCMSHDFICLHMEEEAERLFNTVEKRCPGYFKAPIHIHMRQDVEYFHLVRNLYEDPLSRDLMALLGYEEQV
jgi:hypothetical protein